jgi:hypothetical protein
MPLLNIISDVSGLTHELRESRIALTRIAEALERLSPLTLDSEAGLPQAKLTPEETVHHMAETPEEYEARIASQSEFALGLGINPSSPEFLAVVDAFRQQLTRSRMDINDDGDYEEQTFTPEEAETIISQAFETAQTRARPAKS